MRDEIQQAGEQQNRNDEDLAADADGDICEGTIL